jgi:amidohydrolase
VTALQKVVSRQIDPIEPAVVTIGAIHGGTTHNVIPSTVTLLGTVRAFDREVRAQMSKRIERVLRGVCEASGATYEFDYLWRYPVTVNDPAQAEYARALAAQAFGDDRAVESERHMGAEDFSFYAEKVPACIFLLGSSGGAETSFPHHHGKFDVDEAAFESGIRMMLALALDAPLNAP